MTDKPRRVPIGFVLLVAVLGVAMFWIPSAFVASRGAPWWLCMAVGALAFPVLPVIWQLAAERRRRRKLAIQKAPVRHVLTIRTGGRIQRGLSHAIQRRIQKTIRCGQQPN